jgi:hypothetical protein
MMRHLPTNTLAHYEKMPQMQLVNLSSVNTQLFGQNVHDFRASLESLDEDGDPITNANNPVPDAEAVRFYLFNHLVSIIRERFTRHEPLPKWAEDVMQQYKTIVTLQGIRLTCYMALITTRETRHMNTMEDSWWDENVIKTCGKAAKDFHYKIRGKDSSYVVSCFENDAPAIPVGKFFKAIEIEFFSLAFSHGYGNAPWGHIAQCLVQFLEGKTTQEMMIDTAYTLAHNNGPMFNKGMLYQGYTSNFKVLLDVQRSGQMPEYVLENNTYLNYLSDEQKMAFAVMREGLMGESLFGKYVDWHKVKKAGALTNVDKQIAMQDKKYGKPKTPPKITVFEGKKVKIVGSFDIAPGVSVPIFERIEA